MISISWHFIVFCFIEFVIIVKMSIEASNDNGGFLSGLGCIPYLLIAIILFLLYGGIFLW